MKGLLILFLVTLGAVLLLFAGIGIKMLIRRKGEFRRPCASRDPYTGEGGCECAARKACNKQEHNPYQPLSVTDDLMEELRS